MSYYKRVRSGLCARLEHMLGQIENHEALVESTLKEVRGATRRAQVHLSRVRHTGQLLRARREALRGEEERWKERALRSVSDETRAMECLRRRREAGNKAHELDLRIAQHDEVEARLTRDVEALDKQLTAMAERHQQMRTRQACADASQMTEEAGMGLTGEISNAFERWEMQIAQYDPSYGAPMGDALEDAMEEEEEAASLRAELEALKVGGSP